jgi:hypothetical protein
VARTSRFGSSRFGTFRFGGPGLNKSFSGTQAQAGSLIFVIPRIVSLSTTQAQSGSISLTRRVAINLSGTQGQTGTSSRQIAHKLAGTQAQAGTISRRTSRSFSSTQVQVPTSSRRVNHPLSATQVQAGTRIKQVAHRISGTQAQLASKTEGHAFFRSLSGTQRQSGSLTKGFVHPRVLSGTQPQSGVVRWLKLFPAITASLVERDIWYAVLQETVLPIVATLSVSGIDTTLIEVPQAVGALQDQDVLGVTIVENPPEIVAIEAPSVDWRVALVDYPRGIGFKFGTKRFGTFRFGRSLPTGPVPVLVGLSESDSLAAVIQEIPGAQASIVATPEDLIDVELFD